MDDRDLTALQERLAHLDRAVADLSDVAARQEAEIARLSRWVAALVDREATRDADAGVAAPVADRKPPHW